MGMLWSMLLLLSITAAIVTGKTDATASALLSSGTDAVELMLTLLATMTMWGGLMEILVSAGDAARLGRIFRKVLKPFFPGIDDEEAWYAITMNLSANLLGLGNAATPAGIAAAKRLARLGKSGLRGLGMLLALDNASLQLIPTTVITLRQSAGAAAPGDIWGMTLLISGASSLVAIILMKMTMTGDEANGKLERDRSGKCGRDHRAAGLDDRL